MGPEVPLDDDFRALGLEPGAEAAEVKQAYRRLVKEWHPDRHHLEPYENRALAEAKFREIDEAYRRISKTWRKTSKLRRPSAKDFRAARPAATKPQEAFRSNRKPWSGARIFSRKWPALSLAAAAVILIFLVAVFSNIGHKRPVRVPKKVKRHLRTEAAPPTARPEEAVPHKASPPVPPKPEVAAPVNFFTLGSSTSLVLRIQGRPTRIQGDTWIYGLSEVHFRNGRVCGYNNFDGSLRVRIDPGVHKGRPPGYVTIGSTKQQVLLVQGTPTRVVGKRWYYGFAELIFKDGLVTGYDNYFRTLKVRLLPSVPVGHRKRLFFFTKGSTPDEVLAVQGTPTAVHRNRWSYNFDFVLFRNGKVSGVINSDGALRFVSPGNSGVAEGR